MTIPFNVEQLWGTKARLSVKGEINGFAFRSSIFPGGDGTHHMIVNKSMRQGAGADVGEKVRVTMSPDTASKIVKSPPDFVRAIKSSPEAAACFARLSPSHRRAYIEWIEEAKKPQTREARILKTIAMIKDGGKAE